MAYSNPTADLGRLSRIGALRRLILPGICVSACLASPVAAASNNQVRISGLSDVAFGSISNLAADIVRSESICVYAKAKPTDRYSVSASGSGTGGAFTLSSGTAELPYDVQYSGSPNQSSGTQLTPNQPLSGQQNSASSDDCSSGPLKTASLVIILRSTALGAAIGGTYSGTLTLLVAPE